MSESASGARPAALVTGGAQRIGRAIALALARRGYAVALQARQSRAAADQLVGEIMAAGGRAATVVADLADHAAVLGLVPTAAAAIGPLTLLVNNAAEFEPDEIGHLERARFDRHVAVNLRAPIFLADAFAAQLPAGPQGEQGARGAQESQGAIVNILDQRVLKPTPRFLSYGLSKSALYAATTTLAQALAPCIRVNAVAPGPTLPSARQDAEAFARQVQTLPLERGPTPQQIADAVLYLATATSVTGVTIAVDGGQHLPWRAVDSAEVQE
ncbi:MAG TPA: SDR family oxidoreductase [Xanthobacteraceae bacterium]|nr:SDR family oxidoreductase [Xanthobacteraceae bacterium]